MFESLEQVPLEELQWRWARCRKILQEQIPEAEGLLAFSRVQIYWLSGHFGNGLFWLPLQGKPVLLLRKAIERARLESPVQQLHPFRSFADLPQLLSGLGSALPAEIAAEMSGLSWGLGQNLTRRLPGVQFFVADQVLSQARMVKSHWELQKIALAGERHARVLRYNLPQKIAVGKNELELARMVWQESFQQGHQGLIRMGGPGEELFLGSVSAGDSGNYPTSYNGPVGLRGVHPALPYMGYAGQIWKKGQVLMMDIVFALEGYHTDKAQVYFAGRKQEIPKQVQKAQDFCAGLQDWLVQNLKPGAIPAELYNHCLQQAEEQGWTDGFMGLGGNKVPFVGHGIGLVVDEYPPLADKFEQPLEENIVLALEPKIGLPGLGMVGVENTYRVTEKGGESMTGGEGDIICID